MSTLKFQQNISCLDQNGIFDKIFFFFEKFFSQKTNHDKKNTNISGIKNLI